MVSSKAGVNSNACGLLQVATAIAAPNQPVLGGGRGVAEGTIAVTEEQVSVAAIINADFVDDDHAAVDIGAVVASASVSVGVGDTNDEEISMAGESTAGIAQEALAAAVAAGACNASAGDFDEPSSSCESLVKVFVRGA
jgi:hypothetical protein